MSIIIQNIIIKIFKVISIPNCLIFDLNNFIRLFQLLLIIRTVLKLPILLLLSAYDLTKIELYRMSQEIKHCIRFIEIKTRKIKKKKRNGKLSLIKLQNNSGYECILYYCISSTIDRSSI